MAEPAGLAVLAGEGLDDAHAGHVLLGVGGQLGDALLDLLERRPGLAAVLAGHEDDERDGEEGDRGELRVEDEHRGRPDQRASGPTGR